MANKGLMKTYLLVLFILIVASTPIYALAGPLTQILDFITPTQINIKFIGSQSNASSLLFYFPKQWDIRNFNAFDLNGSTLNLEINETLNTTEVKIIFPEAESPSEFFNYTLEFERTDENNLIRDDFYAFQWSWGNANQELPLKFIYRLPQDFEMIRSLSGNISNNLIDYNREIIVFEGIAASGDYIYSGLLFSRIRNPEVEIVKQVDKYSLREGENLIVTLSILNKGTGDAQNVTVLEKEPSTFIQVKSDEKEIDKIGVFERKQLTFIYQSTAAIENQLIEPTKVTYQNKFGKKFESSSNSENVIVKKEKLFGVIDYGYIITVVITFLITFFLTRMFSHRRE